MTRQRSERETTLPPAGQTMILEPGFPTPTEGAGEQAETGLGGLLALTEQGRRALPLAEVRVRADIAGPACRVVVEQRFANDLDRAMEALHVFPLPPGGAVTEMWLRAGQTEVRAECRERESAERAFAEAREAGRRAGLLTAERSDVHSLRVTNLPPGCEVRVRLVMIQELEQIDGLWQWRFPTVIAPRYLPGRPIGHEGPGVLPDTDRVPDASRLQPPLRLEGGTRLDLEVRLAGPLRRVASAQHALALRLPEAAGGGLRIAPEGRAGLDRDFVLRFETAEPDRPMLRAWTDGKHSLALIEPPAEAFAPALPRDAVFVLDRSGSMSGAKMSSARRALSAALHGLSAGDRFRLLAFDDRVEAFADGFSDYGQDRLDAADRWVERIEARGGTEMLPAIQAALAGDTPEGRLRSVLFITDGQVWNEAELLAAVHHRRGAARFFTLGIDSAVNAALLRGLARLGGGHCELLSPTDDIEAAVARFEARFGSPLAEGLEVEGAQRAEDGPLTLFAGRPALTFLDGAPSLLRVRARGAESALSLEVRPQPIDLPLAPLWARRRIAALEDRCASFPHQAEGLRPEILRLALEHGLLSRQTALVAVDRSVGLDGAPVEIVQPVELPTGWDAAFRDPSTLRLASAAIAPRGPGGGGLQMLRSLPEADIDEPRPRGGLPRDGRIGRADAARDRSPRFAAPQEPPSVDAAPTDPLAELVRLQRADGSFGAEGSDPDLTAAALVALVLAGHDRRRGLRRRTVQKAWRWLTTDRAPRPAARLALELLEALESGLDAEALRARFDADPLAADLPELEALLARLR